MKRITKFGTAILAVAALSFTLAGCSATSDGEPSRDKQLETTQEKFDKRSAPDVTGDTEYNNYIKAQEGVYDNPATVLWCTASFNSGTAPVFTVPIAGKLTSSTVSFFPSTKQKFSSGGGFTWSEENQSVDGMYHGTAVPYRYGFTPGGQYVDFTGLDMFCTTQLTEFQRVSISVVTDADQGLVNEAEAGLDAK
jgi:hypothetical protein